MDAEEKQTILMELAILTAATVTYFFFIILPVEQHHATVQSLSVRLFLVVPRPVAVRQFRKYRRRGCVNQSLPVAPPPFFFLASPHHGPGDHPVPPRSLWR